MLLAVDGELGVAVDVLHVGVGHDHLADMVGELDVVVEDREPYQRVHRPTERR